MSDRVRHNFDKKKVQQAFEKEATRLVSRIAVFYATQLSKAVNQGGPGDPSPPGKPPFNQTGTLLRSLQANYRSPRKPQKKGKRIALSVGTDVRYARALEYGYPKRNLQPRPFFGDTLRDRSNVAKVKREIAKVRQRIRRLIQQTKGAPK